MFSLSLTPNYVILRHPPHFCQVYYLLNVKFQKVVYDNLCEEFKCKTLFLNCIGFFLKNLLVGDFVSSINLFEFHLYCYVSLY